jgi:hypothetical protein
MPLLDVLQGEFFTEYIKHRESLLISRLRGQNANGWSRQHPDAVAWKEGH